MVSQTNLFREYIALRSRVVVYVAAALVVIALVWLVLVITSGSAQVYRAGLLLQLIGVLALAPDIIGKDHFVRPQPSPIPATGQEPGDAAADSPAPDDPLADVADDRFRYYQAHNRLIILGNLLASLCLIAWLAACFIDPRSLRFPGELFIRELLGLAGFAWINGYLLVLIYRAVQTAVPDGILGTFFSVDMGMSVLGVVFAGALYAITGWLRRGLGYVYGSGARRVLRVVTLPLFALGLALELLASFL